VSWWLSGKQKACHPKHKKRKARGDMPLVPWSGHALYFCQIPYNARTSEALGEFHMSVIVSEKGWVVIPADLRKKYNLLPGTAVQVVDYGGVIALVPALADPVRQAAGMLKGRRSLTRALLAEHQAERRKAKARGR
jgi:AbrB family looped-hinge helix DNA binding protein